MSGLESVGRVRLARKPMFRLVLCSRLSGKKGDLGMGKFLSLA